MTDEAAQDWHTARSEASRMAGKHVFVVNGAPVFLEFLRELFQEEQYNVTTTNYVPRTFEMIEALAPDLIIADLVAFDRAGWELLEALHQAASTRDIPVIVVSTSPSLLERARAEQARFGGSHFLAKGFDIEEMLAAVAALTGHVRDAGEPTRSESTPRAELS